MFSGAFTALITPMRDREIDFPGLRDLVEYQLSEGIDGIVVCGTTAETPTLSTTERIQIMRAVADQVKGRAPVIAGVGTNDTARAITAGQAAQECGVDALLHVTPYYNKPSQAGLVAHFSAIENAASLPIVLYNIPGRSGVDMIPETIVQLARLPGIVALKEASTSIARFGDIIAQTAAENLSLALLSGDDAMTLPAGALGSDGVISVVSNLVPRQMSELCRFIHSGRFEEARALHFRLFSLMTLMFAETNPVPVRAGAAYLGFGDDTPRLPLLPLNADTADHIQRALNEVGITPSRKRS